MKPIKIMSQFEGMQQLRGQPVRPKMVWQDRKKEAQRKACRGRAQDE